MFRSLLLLIAGFLAINTNATTVVDSFQRVYTGVFDINDAAFNPGGGPGSDTYDIGIYGNNTTMSGRRFTYREFTTGDGSFTVNSTGEDIIVNTGSAPMSMWGDWGSVFIQSHFDLTDGGNANSIEFDFSQSFGQANLYFSVSQSHPNPGGSIFSASASIPINGPGVYSLNFLDFILNSGTEANFNDINKVYWALTDLSPNSQYSLLSITSGYTEPVPESGVPFLASTLTFCILFLIRNRLDALHS